MDFKNKSILMIIISAILAYTYTIEIISDDRFESPIGSGENLLQIAKKSDGTFDLSTINKLKLFKEDKLIFSIDIYSNIITLDNQASYYGNKEHIYELLNAIKNIKTKSLVSKNKNLLDQFELQQDKAIKLVLNTDSDSQVIFFGKKSDKSFGIYATSDKINGIRLVDNDASFYFEQDNNYYIDDNIFVNLKTDDIDNIILKASKYMTHISRGKKLEQEDDKDHYEWNDENDKILQNYDPNSLVESIVDLTGYSLILDQDKINEILNIKKDIYINFKMNNKHNQIYFIKDDTTQNSESEENKDKKLFEGDYYVYSTSEKALKRLDNNEVLIFKVSSYKMDSLFTLLQNKVDEIEKKNLQNKEDNSLENDTEKDTTEQSAEEDETPNTTEENTEENDNIN